MADKKTNALILLPSSAIEKIGVEPKRILSGMVSDALAVVRSKGRALVETRFRVGNYEFCEPDYRQILMWAGALGLAPDTIIEHLANTRIKTGATSQVGTPIRKSKNPEWYEDAIWALLRQVEGGELGARGHWKELCEEMAFSVVDGSILTLVWDFELLPISTFEWVDGLKIEQIAFTGSPTAPVAPCLPLLNKLICSGLGLTELDLSLVPGLAFLDCHENELTQLDLSAVHGLAQFHCGSNRLIELDLHSVPHLKELACYFNPLARLDLSLVPGLTFLDCDGNGLTKLDLSAVPRLAELNCKRNQLTELDLSAVPGLIQLECSRNQLTKLDLSSCHAFTMLFCRDNQITALDIRQLPDLVSLRCDGNVNVMKLPTQSIKNEKH